MKLRKRYEAGRIPEYPVTSEVAGEELPLLNVEVLSLYTKEF
jgi:hypothetical protein